MPPPRAHLCPPLGRLGPLGLCAAPAPLRSARLLARSQRSSPRPRPRPRPAGAPCLSFGRRGAPDAAAGGGAARPRLPESAGEGAGGGETRAGEGAARLRPKPGADPAGGPGLRGTAGAAPGPARRPRRRPGGGRGGTPRLRALGVWLKERLGICGRWSREGRLPERGYTARARGGARTWKPGLSSGSAGTRVGRGCAPCRVGKLRLEKDEAGLGRAAGVRLLKSLPPPRPASLLGFLPLGSGAPSR